MDALELLGKNENKELNVRIVSYAKGVTGKQARQILMDEMVTLTNINRSLSAAFDNLTADLARERAKNINLLADAERKDSTIKAQQDRISGLLETIEEYDRLMEE